MVDFGFQFVKLLVNFVPYLRFLFPVEAHVARFVLYAVGFDQSRESRGYPFEYRFVAAFLFQFQLLPVLFYLF